MIPPEILLQRWQQLREILAAEKLDVLLVAGRGMIGQFGFLTYAFGYVPVGPLAWGLLWRSDIPPTLFLPSGTEAERVRAFGLIADVRSSGESDASASGATVFDLLVAELRASGAKRVGIVGLPALGAPAASVHLFVEAELRPASLVDVTESVARVKTKKTQWDLEQLRDSLFLAQRAYERALDVVADGIRAQAVVAEIEATLRLDGGLELLVFVDAPFRYPRRLTPTVLTHGDLVTVLVEVANATGYWVEYGGLVSIGHLGRAEERLARACYEAVAEFQAILRPGLSITEAATLFERMASDNGLRLGLGLGHGIGVDHDTPLISATARGVFEEGQVLSIHPHYLSDETLLGAIVALPLRVTSTGCEPLAAVPFGLNIVR